MDQLQHQLILTSIALCLVAAGCGNDGKAVRAEAPVHVDSVLAREAELTRFRAGLAEPIALTGGAKSRDALVRSFVRALETRDSTGLAELLMTRAEFAYMYYPTQPEAQPPYNLSPGLMWFMLEGRSRRGLSQAWQLRGGRPMQFAGYSCATKLSQGNNVVWTGCTVRRQDGTRTVEDALFGPILERDGRYKFVSYSNKL
jgi:hypothetical protein